ncbi:coiled-coil domain-containing protein 74B [Orycteropus afer afer]|uniref:Coiled-coil domain-containing protein 74B n=1 Tax=Orycteropus afer afer TaxID=1230840 RepID=A0A8B7B4L7_ORYAF|nr:coiled-coil domain-containing protein 74B [Orycteropus afer afer]
MVETGCLGGCGVPVSPADAAHASQQGTEGAMSQGKARSQPSYSKKQGSKVDVPQKADFEEEPPSPSDKAPGAGEQDQARDKEAEVSSVGTVPGSGSQSKGRLASPSLSLPPHLRKPTTLQQCEVVIRQLWNANLLQAQELQHLKSLLDGGQTPRPTLDKPMPSSPKDQEAMPSPKAAAARGLSKKCLIMSPVSLAERAILPALKQSLKSSFTERQKRLQVVQSRRVHRSVL